MTPKKSGFPNLQITKTRFQIQKPNSNLVFNIRRQQCCPPLCLQEGLESGEPGTDDGRFYFHLGDALQRVGDSSVSNTQRHPGRFIQEVTSWSLSVSLQAYHWYELGHKRGHFASVWQRSLYNVEGLKAQPWWTPKDTGYTDLVKVRVCSRVYRAVSLRKML